MPNFIVVAREIDEEGNEDVIYEGDFDTFYEAEQRFNLLIPIYRESPDWIEVEAYCLHGVGTFNTDTFPASLNWWNAALTYSQIDVDVETISLYSPQHRCYVRMTEEDIKFINDNFTTFQILT
jgi:hypothetical protein